MENIMKKIIMGPTLFLCLLFLFFNETSYHQCEANAIAIDNSSSVVPMPNNEAINANGTGNHSDTSFDDGHQHSSDVTIVQGNSSSVSVGLPNAIENSSNSNTTEVTAVIHGGDFPITTTTTTQHKKPCPIPNPSSSSSLPRKDHDDNNEGEHKTNQLSMQGNGTDSGNNTSVKDEKHETALEKIGDSIAGVVSTIKKSFTSIFSPGSGLPPQEGRNEYEDCYTNDTIAGGEERTNGSSSSNSTSNGNGGVGDGSGFNMTTLPSQEGTKDQGDLHHPEMSGEKKEGEKILIHPASNNDTLINGGIMSNNTNETNSTTTTTTTSSPLMTTALPVTETTTSAPAAAA